MCYLMTNHSPLQVYDHTNHQLRYVKCLPLMLMIEIDEQLYVKYSVYHNH